MKPVYPLPEAIDGSRDWRVESGSGSVDLVGRELRTPLSATDAARFVRNHELAHVKITPKASAATLCRRYGLSDDAMQVCEDLRVHLFLKTIDVRRPSTVRVIDETAFSTLREIALGLVATLATDDYPVLEQHARNVMCEEDFERLKDGVQLVKRTMTSAKNLFRPIGFRNGTAKAARLFDELFSADCHAEQVPIQRLAEVSAPRNAAVKWGDMRISPLSDKAARRVMPLARTRRFTDEGSVLTAPHRLCVDARVFGVTRRTAGGTVLVDASGSMAFTYRDLQEVVRIAPAATIAVYSGRARTGTLAVVAANGIATDADGLRTALQHGNGNVIDGPALHWLSQQAEPRLWLSDGMVTGTMDRASVALAVDAQRICRIGRITRVATINDACAALRKHQRPLMTR